MCSEKCSLDEISLRRDVGWPARSPDLSILYMTSFCVGLSHGKDVQTLPSLPTRIMGWIIKKWTPYLTIFVINLFETVENTFNSVDAIDILGTLLLKHDESKMV